MLTERRRKYKSITIEQEYEQHGGCSKKPYRGSSKGQVKHWDGITVRGSSNTQFKRAVVYDQEVCWEVTATSTSNLGKG